MNEEVKITVYGKETWERMRHICQLIANTENQPVVLNYENDGEFVKSITFKPK